MNEKLKDQDVLLVKEKAGNEVKVVKGIDSKTGKLETVAPNLENQPDFMKLDKNGNVLEIFFENFNRQFKNPTEFMFFKVPPDMLEKVKQDFTELEKFKIEPPQVKKEHAISPDLVDWKKFENFGITREALEKTGNLDKLLDYQKTNLLPVSIKIDGNNLYSDARFSLRKQEDGRFSPAVHLIRHKPELERPYFGVKFTDEDKKNLLTTGNLGRVVEAEFKQGEKVPVLLSLDKQTNELVAFRKEWIKVPDTYKGVQLNEEQKRGLSEGKMVKIDGMISTKGKEFSANVQFNADKRYFELIFDNDKKQEQSQSQNQSQNQNQNQNQETPKNQQSEQNQQSENKGVRIPTKLLGVELTKEQQKDLKDLKTIYVEGLTNKEGGKYNAYVNVNEEKKKLDFFKYNPDKAKKQSENQTDASTSLSDQTKETKQKKSKGQKI